MLALERGKAGSRLDEMFTIDTTGDEMGEFRFDGWAAL
jgi:hypothetical protein